MTANGWLQILNYCVLLLLTLRPLGAYLYRLFAGERLLLTPVLGVVERSFYRLSGIDARSEQNWQQYTLAMLLFNLLGFVLLYLLLRTQFWLPLNPQHLPNLSADLAFNTAMSFTTNTNWQSYSGEQALSYLSQMLGLTVQNYLSAASGIALAFALIRGFARHSTQLLGNAWVDMTRVTLYLLLPLSLVFALLLIGQGVPQNFAAYTPAHTLEGARQLIAQGPIASQEAIKMLGTNGGGFLNANSAHPFENPTPLSNLLQMLSIFLIGAALTDAFGRAVNNRWQGHAILGAMLLLFIAGVAISYGAESSATNALSGLEGVQNLGNMEGKETRFGIAASALFAVITTAASCGAVNAMHDSFTALGGLVPLLNIQLGEVIIGGVGAGFYGMMLYALIAIFMAGLMVGRTPEYIGKKIEVREVKLAMLAVLAAPLAILLLTAVACVLPAGLTALNNAGPHGFSEILYAYASAAGNNGSAFAGLSANSVFYNTTLGIAMLIGRFAIIVPMLAIAGSLAAKKQTPASVGTLPTDGGLFVALLVAVVLVFGGLTFLPSLVLGPLAEHFAMLTGASF